MVIKSVTTVYFSPTDATKKITKAVVKGLGVSDNTIDLTSPRVRASGPRVVEGDMAVIGVPVYSMGVPKILYASLRSLKGQGKPVCYRRLGSFPKSHGPIFGVKSGCSIGWLGT